MVAIDRNRHIVNSKDVEEILTKDNLRRFRISSKFIEEDPVEVPKDSEISKKDFLDRIHGHILEYAKNLPHRQIMLKIREHDTHAEIIINPVTGAA